MDEFESFLVLGLIPLLFRSDENETEVLCTEGLCRSTLTALLLPGVDELFRGIVFIGLFRGVKSSFSVSEKKFSFDGEFSFWFTFSSELLELAELTAACNQNYVWLAIVLANHFRRLNKQPDCKKRRVYWHCLTNLIFVHSLNLDLLASSTYLSWVDDLLESSWRLLHLFRYFIFQFLEHFDLF